MFFTSQIKIFLRGMLQYLICILRQQDLALSQDDDLQPEAHAYADRIVILRVTCMRRQNISGKMAHVTLSMTIACVTGKECHGTAWHEY